MKNDPMSEALALSLAEAVLIMQNGTDRYSTVEEQNAALKLLGNISEAKILRAEVAQLKQEIAASEQLRWEDQARYLDEWHSYTRELAQIRQERDTLISSYDAGHANYVSERVRRDAAEALLAQITKERDDWKLAFETSNEAVGILTSALEGLEHLWRVHAGVLRAGWEADENEAVALAYDMCAARLVALRTPEVP